MRLSIDDDELVACVSCGLCLPHCPTYRVTGEESASPRGRISAMRAVHFDGAPLDDEFTAYMDLCVQCRACEVVCPSSVPFGRLMEGARDTLAEHTRYQPWWRRLGHRVLGHHRTLLAGSSALAVAQRLGLVPARFGLPRLPVRRRRLRSTGTDVWLHTGCVMDAWQRPVHAATIRVLELAGAGVMLPGRGGACCGALAAHAGLAATARQFAERVMAAMPGDAPVLVGSAGCGAAMKDFGRRLGTPDAEAFSARVLDAHEWLAGRVDRLPAGRLEALVAVQDPCHLRHVQQAHQHVRTVLAPFAELVELDDEGLCCGAGGAYATFHPDMASAIRDRKLGAVARSGATVVASANPGCALHLAAAGIDARHPMELIDEAIGRSRGGR
jgi:glycolate oxidase iron-sulfur subunit